VHQFDTTLVRECSRRNDILVAAFAWRLRNRTAVEPEHMSQTHSKRSLRRGMLAMMPARAAAMLAVVATRNQCRVHVNSARPMAPARPIAVTLAGADRYAYGKGDGLPALIVVQPGARNLPRLGRGSGESTN
jgi:hypothetical protein